MKNDISAFILDIIIQLLLSIIYVILKKCLTAGKSVVIKFTNGSRDMFISGVFDKMREMGTFQLTVIKL